MQNELLSRNHEFMADRLEEIQVFILKIEGIFFNPEALPVDGLRLNSEMKTYDARYEERCRRADLGRAFLLEEILREMNLVEFESSSLLFDLEEMLFSPDFYRTLIYTGNNERFRMMYEAFCRCFEKNVITFEREISPNKYLKLIAAFDFMDPPSSKSEFLEELKKLGAFFQRTRLGL